MKKLVNAVLRVIFLSIIFSAMLSLFFVEFVSAASIDPEVASALEKDASVPIIVTLKEGVEVKDATSLLNLQEVQQQEMLNQQASSLQLIEAPNETLEINGHFNLDRQLNVINGFSGRATKEAVEALAEDASIKSIQYDRPIYLSLSNSRPQINADDVNALSVAGEMIDGTGETVCIVDTGIDYSHAGFGGCTFESVQNGSCPAVLGGIDIANNDSDPLDTNGHGTHVAGIVASRDSTYQGVAPGTKIVAVKVFTDGSDYTTESMVIAGIDWCQTNAAIYGISVVSISLGDEVLHESACDDDVLAVAVNAIAAEGIFVDVASGNFRGNYNFSSGLSSPACASNVTSVGSVNSGDAVSSFSYSSSNLDLLAPGHGIKSLKLGGNFATYAGTSMAAPHVGGAAALFKQYWRKAYGLIPTPQQIENKLKTTGKEVLDSRNGLYFSRVDILNALRPIVLFSNTSLITNSLIGSRSSTGNLVNGSSNESYQVVAVSDVPVVSAFLQLNHGNGTLENITLFEINSIDNSSSNNSTSISNQSTNKTFVHSLNNFPSGNYTYSIFVADAANLTDISEVRTLFIDSNAPEIVINYPAANTSYNRPFALNVSIVDQFALAASNYSIINSSGAVIGYGLNHSLSPGFDNIFNASNSTSNDTNTTSNATSNDMISSFFWQDLLNISNATFPNGNYTLVIFAQDSVGNEANASLQFIIWNNPPANISITPTNGAVWEVGVIGSFTSKAEDMENDTIAYGWNFGDNSALVNQQNTTHFYNSTGPFTFTLAVADNKNTVFVNQTLIVNDTIAPTTNPVTYDAEHHLQRDGTIQKVTASFFDYSGISNASLTLNGTKQDAVCSAAKTTSSCSWNISNLVVGFYNFTLNATDNFTVPHTASSRYTFSVTSCSDSVENGNEIGVDCGGACSVSCVSNSTNSNNSTNSSSSGSGSSSSSGGGSGGGAASSGTTASSTSANSGATASTLSSEKTSSDESAAAAESSSDSSSVSAAGAESAASAGKTASGSALTGGAVASTGGLLNSRGKKIAAWTLGSVSGALLLVYGVGRIVHIRRRRFDF